MKNYYNQIVATQNVKDAFAELKEKFFNPVSQKYALGSLARGIDGMSFSIFHRKTFKILNQIRKELASFSAPMPSIDLLIPKSSNPNKFRTISISALKEKIKHHAVYRIIEPVCETIYEDNLYSYRSKMGAYNAMKDFRRKLLFSGKSYYIFKVDMKDYFDNLDHEILLGLIDKYFNDKNLTKLIKVFIKQKRIVGNDFVVNQKGVIQGISISALLANLYLLELDRDMAKKGEIYFRVGDDIIIMKENEAEIKKTADFVINYLINERKLPINYEKTKIFSPSEPFEYLGYEIQGKTIRIAKRNFERLKMKLRVKLNKKLSKNINYNKVNQNQLLKEIFELIYPKGRLPDHIMWLRYFTLTNDVKQLKEIDDFIENRIRLVFIGRQRNKRFGILPLSLLKKFGYISLSKIYHDITRGRKTFSDYVIQFKS